MQDWWKYLLGAIFGGGGITAIIITGMKLRHNAKQKELDRIHEKEIIKLQHINNKELRELDIYNKYIFYDKEKDMIKFKHGSNIEEKWEKIRIKKEGVKNEK